MAEIILPANGWTPRDYQMPAQAAFERGIKRLALAWHRRAGKDDFALHNTACKAHERVGSYWHMLPMANQARKAIWDAVNPHTGMRRIDEAFPVELRKRTREQDMFIEFKIGSTWQVFGSDNFQSGIGSPPIGVVFSEYAMADPDAWAYIRPILAENDGWAMFISTFRGRNHFHRMVQYALQHPEEWFGQILPVSVSKAIAPEAIERERREIAAERGDKEANALISQEYECDVDAALPGAYYGEHMSDALKQGRIGDFPWLPNLPVGIASDLGHNDQTVNWFYQQLPSGRVRIIDVLPGSNVGVDWYAKRIAAKPYTIVDTIWPHDGDHKNIRDVNGTDLKALARSFGWHPVRCLENESREVGIQAVRTLLPVCEFNVQPLPHMKDDGAMETPDEARARMERALDALRMYRREWDEKLATFRDAPLHDWTSDYADGFRYLARGRKPFPGQRAAITSQPARAIMD
jgi:phage terminase large subunit